MVQEEGTRLAHYELVSGLGVIVAGALLAVSCTNGGGDLSPSAQTSRFKVATNIEPHSISSDGRFLTAFHVIQQMPRECSEFAVYVPRPSWTSSTSRQVVQFFPFSIQSCVSDGENDLAVCQTQQSPIGAGFEVLPANLEESQRRTALM